MDGASEVDTLWGCGTSMDGSNAAAAWPHDKVKRNVAVASKRRTT